MIREKPITRRVLFAACFAVPTRAAKSAADMRHLGSLFSKLSSARAIGAAYLRLYPADGLDAAALAASLPTAATAAELRSVIAARIHDDFANARIVTIDGWMLAVTEARLCVLAYLAA